MKKLLRLKRENWDSKGTSLYEAKVTRKGKSTILSIFIGETANKWLVEAYLESEMSTANKPAVKIKLPKHKYPTKVNCVPPVALYAYEFIKKQKEKQFAKVEKEFSSCFGILETVYSEAVLQGEK